MHCGIIFLLKEVEINNIQYINYITMKALIILLGVLFGTSWLAQAQTTQEADTPQEEFLSGEEYENKRKKVNLADLPKPVKKGFSESEYGNMNIIEAYVLTTEEANKMLKGSRNIEVLTEETMLYELKVEQDNQAATLYFTDEGKLYNVTEEEGIG